MKRISTEERPHRRRPASRTTLHLKPQKPLHNPQKTLKHTHTPQPQDFRTFPNGPTQRSHLANKRPPFNGGRYKCVREARTQEIATRTCDNADNGNCRDMQPLFIWHMCGYGVAIMSAMAVFAALSGSRVFPRVTMVVVVVPMVVDYWLFRQWAWLPCTIWGDSPHYGFFLGTIILLRSKRRTWLMRVSIFNRTRHEGRGRQRFVDDSRLKCDFSIRRK